MKIIKAKNYEDMSQKAAAIIAAQIMVKPDCVLGLATGSSPEGLYRKLVEWYKAGVLSFSDVTSVNLDEYKGLPRENDQSYWYFMNEHLFKHVDINRERTFLPDGMAEDSNVACSAYNEIIRSVGGIDLQLLGIGHNGHIGFNEPSQEIALETHLVDLTESTIKANQRFFASYDDVPKQAYSMGIKTILQAKKILLVVSGEDKAKAVKNAFFGPVTPMVPGSLLQLHRDVVVVADEAALSLADEI